MPANRQSSNTGTSHNMGSHAPEEINREGSERGSRFTDHLAAFDEELSYTVYEQWVKKEIKVRECCVFIKKTDGELEPICHCGNVRSAHVEGIQILGEGEKWDKHTHTTLTECSAFGKINFLDEDTTIQPEYIRVASDYGDRRNIQRMERLLKEFWNLSPPGLLISVIGGNKSFHVPHDICVNFQHGLLNAAKSTNGWIITSGQDEGVAKLVGDIIGRSILTSKIATIGVSNWGKTWNSEMLLRKNNRYNDLVTDYSTSLPEGSYTSLEPNHSHFFLIDDGKGAGSGGYSYSLNMDDIPESTTDATGVELKFRGELEYLITKMYEKDGVPLPMICIMLEGGYQTIEGALNTLRMGQPLVVIKGSGRAADIICYACDITTFKEDFIDGQFTMRGVVSQEGKRDIQDMLEACFSKFKESNMIEKLLTDVMEIASFKKSITIYKNDSAEQLDFAILSSLMKSIGESAARMRQMKLAITWGHEKVAKELIFEKKDYKFKTEELNSLLMFSVVNRRVGFIRLLLDYGADLKNFLTAIQLTKLYNILPKNSGAFRLLARYDRAICLRDIGELIEHVMEGTYHSLLTHERFNQDMREDERFDNPYDLMVVYSALIDAPEMAKFFWEGSRTPIATALIAHKIFLYLDKMEARWARIDEEMTEKLEKSASDFEKLAIGLMTMCYHNYEKQDWVQILVVPLKEWGGLNLFDLATIIEAKNFIAHAAYQSYLTDIWMGQLKPSTTTGKLLLCLLPPLPIFLPFNKVPMSKQDMARKMLRGQDVTTRRKRIDDDVEFAPIVRSTGEENENMRTLNVKEKLYYFYTSPIIKFFLNTLTYIIFLMLYGYGLLVANPSMVINEDGSRLEYQDIYTFVFVISTVPIEISQIRSGRTKNHLKKMKDHFSDTYNLMDFIAVCMFMCAFVLKASTPYKSWLLSYDGTNSMNLNSYGNYHGNRLLSSMCFMFYCFRFVQMFSIHAKIGPKITMLQKMAIDLLFFMFLLIVFMFAYGVTSQALLYPFRESSFSIAVFELLQRSYLNVFGEIDVDGFDDSLKTGHCASMGDTTAWAATNFTGYTGFNRSVTTCTKDHLLDYTQVGKVNYYVAFALLSLYLLFVNVMLINLLIAIFSNTYEMVEQQSGIIYKTQRASMILEFRERPPLPNPLSLFYFTLLILKFLYRRYIKSSDYEKDLQKLMSSMPNRHSSVAYRSSLMEAECRAQFIRKHKKDTGNQVVSALSRQYHDLALKLSRIESQLQFCNEKVTDITETQMSSMKSKIKPSLDAWKDLFTHKLSLTTPYPGTNIERFPLKKDQINWKNKMETYNPPVFDNPEIPHLDPPSPANIKFNAIDNAGVDRISFCGRYAVVDGNPRNPKGRTGLAGKGNLPRWGPNHMSITVISRFKEQHLAEATVGSSSIVTKDNKPVLEMLFVMMEGSDSYVFPQGFAAPKETTRHSQQRVVFDMCYDYSSLSKTEQKALLQSADKVFKHIKEISTAYMDDSMNTDHAWIETSVSSAHDNDSIMPDTFKNGRGVKQVIWLSLTDKVNVQPNLIPILKKSLSVLKAYNPYADPAGESPSSASPTT